MIKRKFGSALRSKSPVGQMNEILCKVIAHNLCVLIAAIYELGLEAPQFIPEAAQGICPGSNSPIRDPQF